MLRALWIQFAVLALGAAWLHSTDGAEASAAAGDVATVRQIAPGEPQAPRPAKAPRQPMFDSSLPPYVPFVEASADGPLGPR